MEGLFLSLDGVDGCGKSTQIDLLTKWLRSENREVCCTREPGGTQLGEMLREILLHRKEIQVDLRAEMLLYMASRAQLMDEVVRPALSEGKVVIADRFLLANVVYQGHAGGLPPDIIWQVGKVATQGLLPILTIILDVDAEVALARLKGDPDRLESRGIEYMQNVRQGFLTEASSLGESVEVLDATQDPQTIHQEIVRLVSARLS